MGEEGVGKTEDVCGSPFLPFNKKPFRKVIIMKSQFHEIMR